MGLGALQCFTVCRRLFDLFKGIFSIQASFHVILSLESALQRGKYRPYDFTSSQDQGIDLIYCILLLPPPPPPCVHLEQPYDYGNIYPYTKHSKMLFGKKTKNAAKKCLTSHSYTFLCCFIANCHKCLFRHCLYIYIYDFIVWCYWYNILLYFCCVCEWGGGVRKCDAELVGVSQPLLSQTSLYWSLQASSSLLLWTIISGVRTTGNKP